jgi:hypothetical protein
LGRLIALTLTLLFGALIAWSQNAPPRVAPAAAPPAAFSAERAFAIVQAVARTPHPMGSAANHEVRDLLLRRMAALGLSPGLRTGDAVGPPRFDILFGGTPQSLVGVLPGRDRAAPAVALMAHYDSRPGAPGAADDGAGVAAVLETVRAIRARGAPARDVVVILTDGEEACLCGAYEVFGNDAVVRHIGLLLNHDARGSSGRTLMFETGPGDGQALQLFRRRAVRPMAGSVFSVVYATLPSDTDFTLARHAGLQGFNYAFTGRAADYHQPTDTPANLDRRALQDMGDQVLSTAAAAAFAPVLPGRAADVVHGVVFGRTLLAYPPAWGWAPLFAAALLLALAIRRAREREPLPWSELARGCGAGLFLLACAASLLHLGQAVATALDAAGDRRLLAQAVRYETAVVLIGVGALLFAAAEAARGRRGPGALLPLLAAVASCGLAKGIDRIALVEGVAAAALALGIGRGPIGRSGAWGGVLLLGLAAATAAQVAAPLAAYVLAWPLLVAAIAAAATDLATDGRRERLLVLALLAVPVAGWAGTYAHLIQVVSGLPELLLMPVFIAAMALWPLAQPEAGAPPARLPGRALLAAGFALLLAVRLMSPWSERHPQPTFVAYQLDQDSGRAWRVTPQSLRSGWSDAVLQADGGRAGGFAHWAWREPTVAAPARVVASPAPTFTIGPRAADGSLLVRVVPAPKAQRLELELAPDQPLMLRQIGGAASGLVLPANRWRRIIWSAPPDGGLVLRLAGARPHGGLRLRYVVRFDRWPAGVTPPPAPPPRLMVVEFSGGEILTGSRRLIW